MDPTKTTYAELPAAWRHFNKALFDNQLPPCLVTLQRRANARGYFSSERFEHRVDRSTTDEIALNPKHFVDRSPADTPVHSRARDGPSEAAAYRQTSPRSLPQQTVG